MSLPPALPFSTLDRISLWFRRTAAALFDASVVIAADDEPDALVGLDEALLGAGSEAAVLRSRIDDPYAIALLGLASREVSRVSDLIAGGRSDRLAAELLVSAVVLSSLAEHGLETYDRPRFVQRIAWPANRRRAAAWTSPATADRYLERLRAGAISKFRISSGQRPLTPVASLGRQEMAIADTLA